MLPWIVLGLAMIYLLIVLSGRKQNTGVGLQPGGKDAGNETDPVEKDRLEVFREFIAGAEWQNDTDGTDGERGD